MNSFEKNVDINTLGILVTDHIEAMLAYWDQNQMCQFANAAYIEYFGKHPHEMIGKIKLKDLLGPIYYSNLPYIQGVLAGEKQTFERTLQLPNGSIRHNIVNYVPHIEDGEIKGFVAHIANITNIKLLENELIKSNEIIRKQNKRLLDFSQITSHNLRSPVNNLNTILKLYHLSNDEATRKTLFDNFEVVIGHLNSTLNDLLKSIKTEEGAIEIPERISFKDILVKTEEILAGDITENQIIITSDFSQAEYILFPTAYMESIILNLLSNAIKYRSPDRDPMIHIKTEIKDKNVVLIICDNGLGIDLIKNRNDFFKLNKTFHDNDDAEGVGLFITKSQIEVMGGQIEVESEVDKGTIFKITFPEK